MLTALTTTPCVRLSRFAFNNIAQTCRAATDGCETGGILLGRQHQNGDLLITASGDPGPKAVRRPGSFRRDPAHAQALADGAWDTDRSVWIGDWHTHPRGPNQPSSLDLASYLSVLNDPDQQMDRFLALIVQPLPGGPVLYPWLVTPSLAESTLMWIAADPKSNP